MSWLLFMDESGHDHKTMPYEGWIRRLEYRDERSASHGRAKKVFGIVFVQNPYGSGEP